MLKVKGIVELEIFSLIKVSPVFPVLKVPVAKRKR